MENIKNSLTQFSHQVGCIKNFLLNENIDISKYIFIPPITQENYQKLDDFVTETIEYILHILNNEGWDKKVLFVLEAESFATTFMEYTEKVVRPLIVNYQFPLNSLGYVTGAANVSYNHRVYYKHCALLNYIPIPLYFNNSFESGQINSARDRELFHSKEPQRKKKILFLNKQPRPHRIAALGQLLRRNLLDKTYLSFSVPFDKFKGSYGTQKTFYPDIIDDTVYFTKKLKDQFPINLTLNDDNSNMHVLDERDLMLYRNSLFSLVTETLFCHNQKYLDEAYHHVIHCYDSIFFTEKTWKPIRAKHPFIILSTPYCLEALREMGYKTFHPYINESYDRIDDEQDRLMAVMDEVERLANMSDNETREWLAGVQEICDHNYKHLLTRNSYLKRLV